MSDLVEETLSSWRASIDAQLARVAREDDRIPGRLREAIHYSVTGEGKRFRGLLVLAAYHSLGGRHDASGLAAAVEVVHAYSLVHDDLPCMDNDDIRRGRPTTHRAFDVPLATVAGVVMVPIAVEQAIVAAGELGLPAETTKKIVAALMRASGASGMVGGQWLDLQGEGRTLSLSDLEALHGAKTGALIAASFTLGGLAAGGDSASIGVLTAAGADLGLAFQIADDVLDATATSETLGKTAGKDAAVAKSTYPAHMGLTAARDHSAILIAEAMGRLQDAGLKTAYIEQLAHFVAARRS